MDMFVDTSVKIGCDVQAEKRRKVLGGTKDGYVRIPDRIVMGDCHDEPLSRESKVAVPKLSQVKASVGSQEQ